MKPTRTTAGGAAMVAARMAAQMAAQMAALLVALASAAPVLAQDRADIDRTKIIGNRELPKVLYIVPWKQPLPGDLSGRPPSSVLDEALAPIDRDVFRRQLQYDAQTHSRAPEPAGTGAPK